MRGVGGIVSSSRRGGGHYPAPPSPRSGILTGAYIKGTTYDPTWADAPWDSRTMAAFESHAGKGCSIIHWGSSWGSGGTNRPFYPTDSNNARNHGSYPMIDWSPSDSGLYGGSTTQPTLSLGTIIAGNWDSYIDSWAAQVATWGHPLFIRLMWEMNGDPGWFPWSESVNGNSAGQYVTAWRRIVTRCRAAGATNITWFWCPNTLYPGSQDLAELYPGDDVVDWVGCDLYNWGTTGGHNETNVPFATRMSQTYDAVYALASATKPFMLGEWGCTETLGNKPAWLTDALTQASQGVYPNLRGLVYFNWAAAGADWPIETSLAAQDAYASGIAPVWFKGSVYGSASTSPIPAPA